MLVDLSGSDVVLPGQGDVEVTLVVTKVEVDFTTVVENEALSVSVGASNQHFVFWRYSLRRGFVLGGCHSSGIDVHVGVDLNSSDVTGRSAFCRNRIVELRNIS